MKITAAEREQFVRDGYLVIDSAVERRLLEPLRAAAGRVTEKTRSGAWPHKGENGEDDIWGVAHLLHPDLGEPVFAEYLASEPVLDVVAALLGPALCLSMVNLLVNPAKREFPSVWHRDMLREELPPGEEAVILARLQDTVQWHTALYEEACFRVVPGSHRRAATPEEREVQFRRPADRMPGERPVPLAAGQGVYYNPQLLHRGLYPVGQRRETLHACLHRHPAEELLPFYYHFVQWLETPGFRATLPERLLPLYDNWRQFAEAVKRKEADPSGA